MRLPYKDSSRFGECSPPPMGSWLSHAVHHATQQVTNVASNVVGSQVASEVQRAVDRTLTTGSPTSGIPIVVNPVGLVYGAVKGDPTSMMAFQIAGAATGLPLAALPQIAGSVATALNVPGFPSMTPGGPDLTANAILDVAGETAPAGTPRFGRKAQVAIAVVGLAALWWYFKKRR